MTTEDNNKNDDLFHEKEDDEEKKEEDEVLLLTDRMRLRTKKIHDKSDKLVNLKLVMVLTSRELYAEAISLFWPIYNEIEVLLEKHRDHPQLGLYYPYLDILRRASKFERDIRFMLHNNETKTKELFERRRPKGEVETFSPPELQDYIMNLRRLSEENPIALIAYVQNMYGAIMAGGFMIKKTVKRAFLLSKDKSDGVEAFEIELNGKFKTVNGLRKELKRIVNVDMKSLTEEQEEAIFKESSMVFVRNNALVATAKETVAFQKATTRVIRFCTIVVIVPLLLVVSAAAILTTKGNNKNFAV